MGTFLSLRPDQACWIPISQHLCLNWILSSHRQGHEGGLLMCEGRAWERRQSTWGCVWLHCDRMPDRATWGRKGRFSLTVTEMSVQSCLLHILGQKFMLAEACSRQEKEKELWGGARARYRFLIYSCFSIGFQFIPLPSNSNATRKSIKGLAHSLGRRPYDLSLECHTP